MEWVKLTTAYYRDMAVATSDDVVEVMFTRGLALAGELESSGFVPEQMLHHLTRRPQHARRTANQLVAKDLWEKVPGGWQIVNWAEVQAELERLVEKKRRDKDRKRRDRAASRAASVDVSADAGADSPAPRPGDSLLDHQSEELDTAAAASRATPPPPTTTAEHVPEADLPGELVILKSKLDAVNLRVRWDRLTPERVDRIVALQHTHGDGPLVTAAQRSYRADSPPQFAQFWLDTWEQTLPKPGETLRVLDAPPCPEPGHSGTTAHCTQCAADQLAGGDR